jgi:hypothetical protein
VTQSMTYRTDPHSVLRSVDIVFQVMAKASYRYDGLFPAVAERHVGRILMGFPLSSAKDENRSRALRSPAGFGCPGSTRWRASP